MTALRSAFRTALRTSSLAIMLGTTGCYSTHGPEKVPVEEEEQVQFGEVDWSVCGLVADRSVLCGSLVVPIDYSNPELGSVKLSIRRALVPLGEQSQGSVFFNPGGPGGSAHESFTPLLERGYFDQIASNFEIISFDPRGVGESGAVSCSALRTGNGSDTQAAMNNDGMMMAPSETTEILAELKAIGDDCKQEWGDLFDYLGSNQVVEDIESMRQALEIDLVNFIGLSYGTRLGALYAQQYPQYTRAVILDAPVAPVTELRQSTVQRMDQILAMNEAFFVACDAGEFECPEQPGTVFEKMMDGAQEQGLQQALASFWRAMLAVDAGREILALLLSRQTSEQDSSWISDMLVRMRDASGGAPSSGVSTDVNLTVHCADVDDTQMSVEEISTLMAEMEQRSPYFASIGGLAAVCKSWPVQPDPVAPLVAPEAPPLLVIGGAYDLQTPFVWAAAMAESLDNAILVRSEHYGHVAFASAGDCVHDVMRDYLETLRLPPQGTICQ